jgi:hypothetical protein
VHEADESPLLEAVARERLVKTQQAGKGLAGAVVVCELWRLAVALSFLHVTIFSLSHIIFVSKEQRAEVFITRK